MHPDDEAAGPPPEPFTDPRLAVERQFVALVVALSHDDPRFVRRFSAPPPGSLGRAHLMIIVGLIATLLLGVLPLAIGVHLLSVALMVVGAVGCVVGPVVAPWLTHRAVIRHRPLRT